MSLNKRKNVWKLLREFGEKQSANTTSPILLNDRVDAFINWYFENTVKEHYTDDLHNHLLTEMRNFIEKMAVWYELRYPDYEINRLMPGSQQGSTNVDEVMFQENYNIKYLLYDIPEVAQLHWCDFYNTESFIQSLPWNERRLLKYTSKSWVFVEPKKEAYLHLTPEGFVEQAGGFDVDTEYKTKNEELVGMRIQDVILFLKEKGIVLPNGNELEKMVHDEENWLHQREGILDSVMYRIVERGGERSGPRRGFLFAQEFGRNIDIPMMYGIDFSDPGLKRFVRDYICAGGSEDLECYVDYFRDKNGKVATVTVKQLLPSICIIDSNKGYQKK